MRFSDATLNVSDKTEQNTIDRQRTRKNLTLSKLHQTSSVPHHAIDAIADRGGLKLGIMLAKEELV